MEAAGDRGSEIEGRDLAAITSISDSAKQTVARGRKGSISDKRTAALSNFPVMVADGKR
jgi:hypothetical protein